MFSSAERGRCCFPSRVRAPFPLPSGDGGGRRGKRQMDMPCVVKIHTDSINRSRPKLPHFWHFPHWAASKSENLDRDPGNFLHGIVELNESFQTHVSDLRAALLQLQQGQLLL